MCGKCKNICSALIYFEPFLVFVSAVSGCVSISEFASLVGSLHYAVEKKLVQ